MNGGTPRLVVRPLPGGWRAMLSCRHSTTDLAQYQALGAATPETVAAAARQAHERAERCGCANSAQVRLLGTGASQEDGGLA
jgi:hypothetical protein